MLQIGRLNSTLSKTSSDLQISRLITGHRKAIERFKSSGVNNSNMFLILQLHPYPSDLSTAKKAIEKYIRNLHSLVQHEFQSAASLGYHAKSTGQPKIKMIDKEGKNRS